MKRVLNMLLYVVTFCCAIFADDNVRQFEAMGCRWNVYDEDNKYVELAECLFTEDFNLPSVITDPGTGENYQYKKIGISAYPFTTGKCKQLTSIVIPEGVEFIDSFAFENCYWLKQCHLPSTLVQLGIEVFRGCVSLESIEIPGSLKKLPQETFKECAQLKSVKFNDGLEIIDEYPFELTVSLERFEFPSSITQVNRHLFSRNYALNTLIINKGATGFDATSFTECPNLSSIIYYTDGNLPKPLEKDIFNSVTYSTAVLYVSEEDIEAISEIYPWSKFETILPIEKYQELPPILSDFDENTLFDMPNGELKIYKVNATYYNLQNDHYCSAIYTDDGYVYLKNIYNFAYPVSWELYHSSSQSIGAWIKCSLDETGTKILVPMGSMHGCSRSVYKDDIYIDNYFDIQVNYFDERIFPVKKGPVFNAICQNEKFLTINILENGNLAFIPSEKVDAIGVSVEGRLSPYRTDNPYNLYVMTDLWEAEPIDIPSFFPAEDLIKYPYSVEQSFDNHTVIRDIQIAFDFPYIYIFGLVPGYDVMSIKGEYRNGEFIFRNDIDMGILHNGFPYHVYSPDLKCCYDDRGIHYSFIPYYNDDTSDGNNGSGHLFKLKYDPKSGDLISNTALFLNRNADEELVKWINWSPNDFYYPFDTSCHYALPNNWYLNPKFINKSDYIIPNSELGINHQNIDEPDYLFYDLLGRPVSENMVSHGIYICNGKKIMR